MSEVVNFNIQIWRQKCKDGTITLDEMKAAIAAIRKERTVKSEVSATSTAKKRVAKAKAAPIDSDDLLKELGI